MKQGRTIKRYLVMVLIAIMTMGVLYNPALSMAKVTTKVTVDTQKELNAALNNSKITEIIIKTSDSVFGSKKITVNWHPGAAKNL